MDVATVIYTVFCAPTELWSYLVAVTQSGTEYGLVEKPEEEEGFRGEFSLPVNQHLCDPAIWIRVKVMCDEI